MKKIILLIVLLGIYLNSNAICTVGEPFYIDVNKDTTLLVNSRCCGNVLDYPEISYNRDKLTPYLSLSQILYLEGNVTFNCCGTLKYLHVINLDTLVIISPEVVDTGQQCTCECFNLINLKFGINSKKVHVKYGLMDTVVYAGGNAINEVTLNKRVSVYPNPASNQVTFEVLKNAGQAYDVKILDIAGRCIYRQNRLLAGKQTIDIASFKSGLYTYEVILNNQQRVRGKLVKE